jgi:lauroyl/myristoyl acyltransferase
MRLGSLLIDVASPMRRLRRRVPLLERLLRVPLTEEELRSIGLACERSGVELGAFYHWYLQKWVVSRHVRRLEKASTLRMISRMDRTDYAPVDALQKESRGLLFAIPHHGHYILSIVALAERLRTSREVLIFYGNPQTHAGNEIFDHLYGQLFGDASSGVRVIHDTRAGMASALRGLKEGAAVIIMPDVYKQEHDTYLVPFCGRPLNVMLGTAALARKTGAVILPMVSQPAARGFGFSSVFGALIDERPAEEGTDDSVHASYRLTAELFRQLEAVMDPAIVYWQYVRSHYLREASFPELAPDAVSSIAELLFVDPRVNVDLSAPLRLD